MKNCQHCGRQIGDTEFCPHCGQKQNVQQVQSANRRRLHCPHCKSVQLTALVESNTTTGTAVHSRVTKGIGVTTYNARTRNRHYWMCRECGHKFRNLENLNAELKEKTKAAKVEKIIAIVFGVLCVLLLASLISAPGALIFLGIPILMLVALEIFFIIAAIIDHKSVERMTADKAYLEKNCFD